MAAATLAAAASGAAAAPPNILFCVADDWSWPHAGAYGCRWARTPAFDRVASNGLLFARCYTPNAKCAPSRACILTGRNSWQLGAAANHVPVFPPEYPSVMEVLARRGWHAGWTGKGWAPGNAGGRELTGRAFNKRRAPPPANGISAIDYAANFEEFLSARPDGAPFIFWYGATEPHRAYEYGSGLVRGGRSPADVDRVPAFWPDDVVIRTDLLDYAFEVEHFDRHLGRMLDLLAERGELSNTVVFVTSDNGMPFPRCKGNAYELSNHMPLAVQWLAGIREPGRRVEDFISLVDLAPTFLDLAGLTPSTAGMPPMAGRSLMDIFSEEPGRPIRDAVLIGMERHDMGRPFDWGYPARGIVADDLLYIINYEPMRWPAGNPETGYMNCDGSPTKTRLLEARRREPASEAAVRYWSWSFGRRPSEELYDVRTDPDCVTNLADRVEFAGRKAALRKRMEAQLAAQDDLRMVGRGREYEAHPYAHRDHARYYERWAAGEKVTAGWISPGDPEPAFYAAAPHIRRFEWVPDPGGPRLVWDADGNPLDRTPTVLRIDPDIGFLPTDAGEIPAVGDAAEWVLTALNPGGTNRVTAKQPAR